VYSLFPFDLYAVAGRSTSHGMNFMKIATLPLSVVHPFTFFSFLVSSPTYTRTSAFPYLLDAVSLSLPLSYSVMSLHSLHVLVFSIFLDSIFLLSWCYLYLILMGMSVPCFLHRLFPIERFPLTRRSDTRRLFSLQLHRF
jgi:hypothetical protein